ncbi:MAG: hypothetical protein ACOCP8_02710 [archaeon]
MVMNSEELKKRQEQEKKENKKINEIVNELREFSKKCNDIETDLPNMPIKKWFDDTDDICFTKCNLGKVLHYIADLTEK